MADDSEIAGINPDKLDYADPRRLAATIASRTEPTVMIRRRDGPDPAHSLVAVIEVPATDDVHATSKGRYLRRSIDVRGEPQCLRWLPARCVARASGAGAAGLERAGGAECAEAGRAGVDGPGVACGAGHGLGVGVDGEVVSGEAPAMWGPRSMGLIAVSHPASVNDSSASSDAYAESANTSQPPSPPESTTSWRSTVWPVGSVSWSRAPTLASEASAVVSSAAVTMPVSGSATHVGLVAVAALRAGLVCVAGLGVHGGDHPAPSNPASDAPATRHLGVGLDVLARHHSQQPDRLTGGRSPLNGLCPSTGQSHRSDANRPDTAVAASPLT